MLDSRKQKKGPSKDARGRSSSRNENKEWQKTTGLNRFLTLLDDTKSKSIPDSPRSISAYLAGNKQQAHKELQVVKIQSWWRMVRARRWFMRYRALRRASLGRYGRVVFCVWLKQLRAVQLYRSTIMRRVLRAWTQLLFKNRLVSENGKEFFERWRDWTKWRKQRLQELRLLMDTASKNIELSKARIVFQIWHRYSVLVQCEGSGKPLPVFTPTIPRWDAWLSHHNWLIKLNSMASKIYRHGLLNSIVKRWKSYWLGIKHKKDAELSAIAHHKKKMTSEAFEQWRDVVYHHRASNMLCKIIFRRWQKWVRHNKISLAAQMLLVQKRNTFRLRSAISVLKRYHRYRSVVDAAGFVSLRSSPSKAYMAAYAFLGWKPHFNFIVCWISWFTRAKRRLVFKRFLERNEAQRRQMAVRNCFRVWRKQYHSFSTCPTYSEELLTTGADGAMLMQAVNGMKFTNADKTTQNGITYTPANWKKDVTKDILLWCKIVMMTRANSMSRRILQQKRMQPSEVSIVHKRDAAMAILRSFGVDNPKHFKMFKVALREDAEDVIDLAKFRKIRDQYLLLVEAVDTAAVNLHAIRPSFTIDPLRYPRNTTRAPPPPTPKKAQGKRMIKSPRPDTAREDQKPGEAQQSSRPTESGTATERTEKEDGEEGGDDLDDIPNFFDSIKDILTSIGKDDLVGEKGLQQVIEESSMDMSSLLLDSVPSVSITTVDSSASVADAEKEQENSDYVNFSMVQDPTPKLLRANSGGNIPKSKSKDNLAKKDKSEFEAPTSLFAVVERTEEAALIAAMEREVENKSSDKEDDEDESSSSSSDSDSASYLSEESYDSDDYEDEFARDDENDLEDDEEETGDPYWDMELPERRKYLYEKYVGAAKGKDIPTGPKDAHPLAFPLKPREHQTAFYWLDKLAEQVEEDIKEKKKLAEEAKQRALEEKRAAREAAKRANASNKNLAAGKANNSSKNLAVGGLATSRSGGLTTSRSGGLATSRSGGARIGRGGEDGSTGVRIQQSRSADRLLGPGAKTKLQAFTEKKALQREETRIELNKKITKMRDTTMQRTGAVPENWDLIPPKKPTNSSTPQSNGSGNSSTKTTKDKPRRIKKSTSFQEPAERKQRLGLDKGEKEEEEREGNGKAEGKLATVKSAETRPSDGRTSKSSEAKTETKSGEAKSAEAKPEKKKLGIKVGDKTRRAGISTPTHAKGTGSITNSPESLERDFEAEEEGEEQEIQEQQQYQEQEQPQQQQQQQQYLQQEQQPQLPQLQVQQQDDRPREFNGVGPDSPENISLIVKPMFSHEIKEDAKEGQPKGYHAQPAILPISEVVRLHTAAAPTHDFENSVNIKSLGTATPTTPPTIASPTAESGEISLAVPPTPSGAPPSNPFFSATAIVPQGPNPLLEKRKKAKDNKEKKVSIAMPPVEERPLMRITSSGSTSFSMERPSSFTLNYPRDTNTLPQAPAQPVVAPADPSLPSTANRKDRPITPNPAPLYPQLNATQLQNRLAYESILDARTGKPIATQLAKSQPNAPHSQFMLSNETEEPTFGLTSIESFYESYYLNANKQLRSRTNASFASNMPAPNSPFVLPSSAPAHSSHPHSHHHSITPPPPSSLHAAIAANVPRNISSAPPITTQSLHHRGEEDDKDEPEWKVGNMDLSFLYKNYGKPKGKADFDEYINFNARVPPDWQPQDVKIELPDLLNPTAPSVYPPLNIPYIDQQTPQIIVEKIGKLHKTLPHHITAPSPEPLVPNGLPVSNTSPRPTRTQPLHPIRPMPAAMINFTPPPIGTFFAPHSAHVQQPAHNTQHTQRTNYRLPPITDLKFLPPDHRPPKIPKHTAAPAEVNLPQMPEIHVSAENAERERERELIAE